MRIESDLKLDYKDVLLKPKRSSIIKFLYKLSGVDSKSCKINNMKKNINPFVMEESPKLRTN